MALLANLTLVFVAGLITALATGLGAIPFFVVGDVSVRWNVTLWGLASGIMVAASLFGLVREGLAAAGGSLVEVGAGVVVGVVLVIVSHRVIHDLEVSPQRYEQADFTKLLLILGILTVHSFPEGVAIGVSFADLNLETTEAIALAGFAVPLLAVFMTIAISIHNVPEGIAISIPLEAMGVSDWRKVWWAVFSSLPQPVGAVLAFYFVRIARDLLPAGFGFAAGAMVYLVISEFIPEALDLGEQLPSNGYPELAGGVLVGVLVMVPLAFA